MGQSGCPAYRWEPTGTAESSGSGRLAPSVLGAGAVPAMGGSTELVAEENREREG